MTDYNDNVFRLSQGSDVVRIRAGALVQLFVSDTDTLQWEGNADADGAFEVSSLPTGKYDLRIDGSTVTVIQHVKADHSHKPDQSWGFFKSGAITADQDEVNSIPIYGTDAIGTIEKIIITAQTLDATGDVTVHLLKGSDAGGSVLTVGTDSVWNHRINPGSAQKRYFHQDNNPGVSLSAEECVTIGIDHTANVVEGLTVLAIFRPT